MCVSFIEDPKESERALKQAVTQGGRKNITAKDNKCIQISVLCRCVCVLGDVM